MSRIFFKSFEIHWDPIFGYLWHRVDVDMNPTPNGDWGVASSLEEAMEEVDGCISEGEAREWSEPPLEKATAFGTVESKGDRNDN